MMGCQHTRTLGLQACKYPPKGKRKCNEGQMREGNTKGKGGLNKKLQIPSLPPKWPRSGVTFHFKKVLCSQNPVAFSFFLAFFLSFFLSFFPYFSLSLSALKTYSKSKTSSKTGSCPVFTFVFATLT